MDILLSCNTPLFYTQKDYRNGIGQGQLERSRRNPRWPGRAWKCYVGMTESYLTNISEGGKPTGRRSQERFSPTSLFLPHSWGGNGHLEWIQSDLEWIQGLSTPNEFIREALKSHSQRLWLNWSGVWGGPWVESKIGQDRDSYTIHSDGSRFDIPWKNTWSWKEIQWSNLFDELNALFTTDYLSGITLFLFE